MDLRNFSWVHVEGRNKANVLDILAYLDQEKKVKFSVEVEKVNRGFEDFIPFGDVVFISKVIKIVVFGRPSFENESMEFVQMAGSGETQTSNFVRIKFCSTEIKFWCIGGLILGSKL